MRSSKNRKISISQASLLLIWIGLVCLNTGCSEEIDWEVQDEEARLVVEGAVTDELKRQYIKIGMSQALFAARANTGISHAQVTVHDGEQSFLYEEDPENKGYYQSIEAFAGQPGKTYNLEIELPEPVNGTQYLHASAMMVHELEFDSMRVRKEKFMNEDFFTVRVSGQRHTASRNYYFIHVYRNGEKLTKQLTDAIMIGIEDEDVQEDFYFDDFAIYRSEDIREGDQITLEVQSLTESYYTFLANTVRAIEGNSMMGISGPPANAIGNFGNEVMGYFSAVPVFRISSIAVSEE